MTFTWKALRIELSQSAWLEPGDDIDSQRGLVATALAITERMSVEYREISWRPLRLVERDQRAADTQAAVSLSVAAKLGNGNDNDQAGGSLVLNPVPPPTKPRGGLAASRVQEESLAW